MIKVLLKNSCVGFFCMKYNLRFWAVLSRFSRFRVHVSLYLSILDQILDTESYISTSIDGCVKLRLQDSPEILPISVPSLLEKAAKEAPEVLALSVKREDKWIKWTYKEYLQGKHTT